MAFSTIEALQAFGLGAQMAHQRRTYEREEREADRKERTREAVSSRVGAGDYQGASEAAIQGGEYNIAEHLGKLDDRGRKQAFQEAQVMGGVAEQLRAVPVEQRTAAFQQIMPALRQAGFSDEELAAADLSDMGLEGYSRISKSVAAALAPRRSEQDPPFIRELEAAGIDPQSPEGRQMLANRYAPQPRLVTDPATGQISIMGGVQPPNVSAPGGAQDEAGLRAQAEEAIRRGAPREQVMERLNQLLGQQGGASPDGSHTFP